VSASEAGKVSQPGRFFHLFLGVPGNLLVDRRTVISDGREAADRKSTATPPKQEMAHGADLVLGQERGRVADPGELDHLAFGPPPRHLLGGFASEEVGIGAAHRLAGRRAYERFGYGLAKALIDSRSSLCSARVPRNASKHCATQTRTGASASTS
jgi:hypothetical protein